MSPSITRRRQKKEEEGKREEEGEREWGRGTGKKRKLLKTFLFIPNTFNITRSPDPYNGNGNGSWG